MSQRLVYLVERDPNIAGRVTIHEGKVLLNLPNYTKVYASPVEPDMADEFCYALEVDEEHLNEVSEVAGQPPTLMLWDGPKNQRGYSTSIVTCTIHTLNNPLARVNQETIGKLRKANKEAREAQQLVQEVQAKRDELQRLNTELKERVGLLEDTVRTQHEEVTLLQGQLADTSADKLMERMSVATMARIMRSCSDEVIEALPHIGPETVKNVRHWAEGVLAKEAHGN